MTTTTATRTRSIALDVDLRERFSLDHLLADDAAIVDVWSDDNDGEATVTLLGADHVLTVPAAQYDDLLARVQASKVLGWGREVPLPDVEVLTLDGDAPSIPLEAGAFVPARRERFAAYRAIESVLG